MDQDLVCAAERKVGEAEKHPDLFSEYIRELEVSDHERWDIDKLHGQKSNQTLHNYNQQAIACTKKVTAKKHIRGHWTPQNAVSSCAISVKTSSRIFLGYPWFLQSLSFLFALKYSYSKYFFTNLSSSSLFKVPYLILLEQGNIYIFLNILSLHLL